MLRLTFLVTISLGLTLLTSHASPETAVLDAYAAVGQALAGDDLAAAKKAAAALATEAATAQPTIAAAATKIADSSSLEDARKEFKTASQDAIKLASGQEGYYVMTCPMAHADWVQKTPKVNNPYYGKAMLECGVPKAPQ